MSGERPMVRWSKCPAKLKIISRTLAPNLAYRALPVVALYNNLAYRALPVVALYNYEGLCLLFYSLRLVLLVITCQYFPCFLSACGSTTELILPET